MRSWDGQVEPTLIAEGPGGEVADGSVPRVELERARQLDRSINPQPHDRALTANQDIAADDEAPWVRSDSAAAPTTSIEAPQVGGGGEDVQGRGDDAAVADAAEEAAGMVEAVEPGPSMRAVFSAEHDGGVMIAMEGGVLNQVTQGAAGEAEYTAGDQVTHLQGKEALYEIVKVLGEGAFGAVYEGKPTAGGGAVALKAVRPSLPPEKKRQLQVQLAAESAICFAIGTHAHLVSVRRVLATPKGLLIAMDLVEGTDLFEYAGRDHNGPLYQKDGGRQAVNQCLDSLVAQLYSGLGWLHERAVLHMDIKPNVGHWKSSIR